MTTSDNNRSFRYEGNGVTDTFSFPARIFTTGDIVVEIITRATDALEETLTISTDYTVTISGDETASVQVTNVSKVPSALQDIQLRSALTKTQTVDLPSGTSFPAKSVEDALDRVTVIVQEVSEDIDRSIKLSSTSSLSNIELPTPSASEVIGWNSAADNLTTYAFAEISTTLDTVFSGLVADDLLQFDGSNWVNISEIGTGQIADDAVTYAKLGDDFINSATSATITTTDEILFGDISDSNNTKKDTVQGILDLVPTVDNATDATAGLVELATDAEVTAETETGSGGATLVANPSNMHYHNGVVKQWVRFNNGGSITVDYGVSSVTDVGTGQWRVNFDDNYSSSNDYVAVATPTGHNDADVTWSISAYSTSYVEIGGWGSSFGTRADIPTLNVIVVGNI